MNEGIISSCEMRGMLLKYSECKFVHMYNKDDNILTLNVFGKIDK